MKKVQLPIALPIMLVVVIVALTGMMLYNNYKQEREQQPVPMTQNTQTEQGADTDRVYGSFVKAQAAIKGASAGRSTFAKGEYLHQAAYAMNDISALCSQKEQNLQQYSATIGEYLTAMSDKLLEGGELSAADSSNLSAIVQSMEQAAATLEKAANESNGDYLKGEFALPAFEQNKVAAITSEQAAKMAASLVENPTLSAEEDGYYSFSNGGYILEVGKNNGVMQYRKLGYSLEDSGEMTVDKLKTAVDAAKKLLKDKEFGDMAVRRWQYSKGEISIELCPVINNIVYLNAPFNVIMSADSHELLGLRTSTITTVQYEDNSELYAYLKKTYGDNNYIIKVVNEYGAPCYEVSYNIGGAEYLGLWHNMTEREIKIAKITNTVYGRGIEQAL